LACTQVAIGGVWTVAQEKQRQKQSRSKAEAKQKQSRSKAEAKQKQSKGCE
jgi:hypothetical protein